MSNVQFSSWNENFVSTSKNVLKNRNGSSALFHIKPRVCLEYFVNDCSLINDIFEEIFSFLNCFQNDICDVAKFMFVVGLSVICIF